MDQNKGGIARGIFNWFGFDIFCVFVCTIIGISTAHAKDVLITNQVQKGATIFSAHCAKCHGSALQGKAGPPLKGHDFESTIEFGHMTTNLLYTFISHAMPADNPGSLSSDEYVAVMSFILSENGYSFGGSPLTVANLDSVKLLPYPNKGTDASR